MMSRSYSIFSLLFLAVTQWNVQIVLSDSRKRNIANINVIHKRPKDDKTRVIPYSEHYSYQDISKLQKKGQKTDSCLSNKKSLDISSSADFIYLQLSFVYMLESDLGWEPTRDLYCFEDAMLKELERRIMICEDDTRLEVKDDHERKSDFASYIVSMDSSPDDYILSNGFCIPSIQNATCQVIQGSMSLSVKNVESNQMSILPNVTLEFFSSVKDIINNSTFVSSINPHLFQGRYESSSTMDFDTTLKDLRLITPKKIVVGPAVTIVSTGSISILCFLCFVVCQKKKRNKTNTAHKSTDCDDILIEEDDREVSTISPWNQTSFYCSSSEGEDGWIDDIVLNHSNLNTNSSLFLAKSPIHQTTSDESNSSTSLSGMKSILGGPLDVIDEEQPCQCLEETDEDCINYSDLEQARGILFDI